MDQEKDNVDGGKAKYLQVHTILRQMAMLKAGANPDNHDPPPCGKEG